MGAFGSKYASTLVTNHDLHGKVAIVTGPISGIGYETSKVLASVGCHVILAGRGLARLEKTASRMTNELSGTHPNIKPQLTCIELDLTSLQSIDAFVNKFQTIQLPIHYLFNNAGVALADFGHTVDGFELQLGTNCVGHQYLTNRVMSILMASGTPTAPVRVIWTSSDLHNSNYNIDGGENEIKKKLFPKQEEYSRFTWYTHSKLGNIYQAQEITKRYGSQGVISIACHPGVVSTDLNRQTWYIKAFSRGMSWIMKNSNQGAATQIWLALDLQWPKQINEPDFSFYAKDCHLARTNILGQNHTFRKLWYDVTDSEIARVATQLGLPLGATSAPAPNPA